MLETLNLENVYGRDALRAVFIDIASPGSDTIDLESIQIRNVEVYHCQDSRGCCIEIDGRWRLGYSGDRAPYDNFVGEVRGVDLLIHDATYRLDPQGGDAGSQHSSPADAMQCGKLLSAQYVVLTHRSHSFTKEEPIELYPVNVIGACDFLAFSFEDCGNVSNEIHERLRILAESHQSFSAE
jgi:ribonuclease BN (tRNA processing enzyme)